MAKNVAFLYDMVTGIFADTRTYKLDKLAEALSAQIKKASGYDDNFIDALGGCLAYTVDLQFQWSDDAPPELRALEEFWRQYKSGVEIAKCFAYYGENISNLVLQGERARYTIDRLSAEELADVKSIPNLVIGESGVLWKSTLSQMECVGWNDALTRALKSWTPPNAWKMLSELPEADKNDPLFSKPASASG